MPTDPNAQPPAPHQPAGPAGQSLPIGMAEAPARIMIVEDEGVIALHLRCQLEDLGFDVVGTASRGEDAVPMAHKLKPDLLLMDIHLPGKMDGIDAATQIHRELASPIVFLTAYAEPTTLARAREAKPYGYLVKPFETRELNATLQMALERHRTAAAVARSQARLSLALESTDACAWELDLKLQRLVASGQVKDILGWDATQSHQDLSAFLAQVHEQDRTRLQDSVRQATASLSPLRTTVRFHHPAKGLRWLEMAGRLSDGQPGASQLYGVVRDITEQRRKDMRLRTAAAAFEAAGEAIVATDALGRIVSINPAFATITGYIEADALGRDLGLLTQQVMPQVQACLADGTLWQGQIDCQRRDGETFSAWISLTSVRDDDDARCVVAVLADIQTLKAAQESLRQMAHHDALTGLPNRALFTDRMEQAIVRSRRSGRPFSLVCLDLNGFKQVNDTHGHAAGDELLKAVADRLSQCARAGDTVARLGGDEFMVVGENLNDPREGAAMCERIIKAMEAPIDLGRIKVVCGASLGVAAYPQDGDTLTSLIAAADAAMYSAKAMGGNQYRFFSTELAARQAERTLIETQLRQALQGRELLLYFQPQVDLVNGRIDAVEALLRWQHPQRGLLSPHEFLPLARETGLMRPISRYVLELACEAMVELALRGHDMRVCINCSPAEIHADGHAEAVRDILDTYGVRPDRLEIEITEDAMIDFVRGSAKVDALRQMGIGVAVDDFGFGQASLSALKKLPLTRLKLDPSLIEGLPGDTKAQAIVAAIIDLAKTLKMHIVAEGVETSEQLNCLRQLGDVGVQGYLLARPMPMAELLQFLSDPARLPTA